MAALLNYPSDEEVIACIEKKENFNVEGRKQGKNVDQVEKLLESKGYTVRVKTKGREATMLIPVLNIWNVTVQVAHNLATYDPDWVIYKSAFGSKIDVKYFGKDA